LKNSKFSRDFVSYLKITYQEELMSHRTIGLNLTKEGLRMKRAVVLAAVALFSGFGLLAPELSLADGAIDKVGIADAVVGGKPLKATEAAKKLQGRVWSQWADNPDGELLFGIQYWNTGEPGSGVQLLCLGILRGQ
jgi:hypothetical protein